MSNAIDCTGLSQAQVNELKTLGVKFAGRYLSKSTWKGLSKNEVVWLKDAGIDIFSIYETNPTHASYFSYAQGQADAATALDLTRLVGQPAGSAIYFTVDYDAQPRDYGVILDYFKALKAHLVGYKVGAYGSFAVLNEIHSQGLAELYFQTEAWSYGQKGVFVNIYQAECNTTLGGVQVDIDEIVTAYVGAWGQMEPKAAPLAVPKPAVVVPTPPAPIHINIAPIHTNIEIPNLSGLQLGAVENYIKGFNWYMKSTTEAGDAITLETGIFDKGSHAYQNFISFLTELGVKYNEKAPQ